MTRRVRWNHSSAIKVKVAMVALKGDSTLAELVQAFDVRANQTTQWKLQLQEGAAGLFGSGSGSTETKTPTPDIKVLHAKIVELALENDFLEGVLIKAGMRVAQNDD
jgi:transposase